MRYAVFFDLQKAFNSVPHQALLAKLHTLGVDNFLLKWICHYLLDGKQSLCEILYEKCGKVVGITVQIMFLSDVGRRC